MKLASGTVVSRILGFISAIILTKTLGIVGAGADTFALANQLPNNVYALVAGGVLSAILVPHIVKAGLDKDGGQGPLETFGDERGIDHPAVVALELSQPRSISSLITVP